MKYIFVETRKNRFIPTSYLTETNHFNKTNTTEDLSTYDLEFNPKNNILESGDSVLVQNIFGKKDIYNFYLV